MKFESCGIIDGRAWDQSRITATFMGAILGLQALGKETRPALQLARMKTTSTTASCNVIMDCT
jgi:hypothetical protein